jgi:hypothetical protein
MGRSPFGWLIGLLVVAALAGAGVYVYDLGVARGIADSGRLAAVPGAAGVPLVPYWAIWPRPWGFGFGFFPFFPLLFILLWFVLLRGFFWRGGWSGRGYRHGGVPPAFEEWHRRVHAQEQKS